MLRDKFKIIQIIYFILVVIVFGILIIAAAKDSSEYPINPKHELDISLENGWVDEASKPVDLHKLTDVSNANTGEWVSIYHMLPETIPAGSSFCMQTGYIYYKVYLDGELLYEPDVPESCLYNASLGHAWCFVPISELDAGKELEIRFTCSYPDEKAYIQKTFIGSGNTYLTKQLKDNGISLMTSILLLFLGIIYIIISIPIALQSKSIYEMVYLGLLSIFVAAWSMSETRLVQLLLDNSRTMNLLSDITLMMISIPSVLYADMAIKNRLTKPAKMIATISICQIFVSVLLHIFNIAEFRSMLFSTHIVMLIGAAYILYRVTRAIIKKELESAFIYQIFRIVGLVSFVFCTVVDLYRYYNSISGDRAMFVRIGLLIFATCYGIASMEKLMRAIKSSAESAFITKLAYQDGLTGAGNRTAYQEYLENIQERLSKKDPISVGMVMFDINNLKTVNDETGHLTGDQLIKICATLIKESFCDETSRVYRIGGDEFAVLEVGDISSQTIQDKIHKFVEHIDDFNKENDLNKQFPFTISVACGMACYKENHKNDTLEGMIERADARMYQNKQAIKNREL